MKGFRSIFVSFLATLLAIAAVALVYPYDAMSFRPQKDKDAKAVFAAFVTLSPAEKAAAMKAAKSSWNTESGVVRRMRAELFVSELPAGKDDPALEVYDRMSRHMPSIVEPGVSPFMPTRAAPPPKTISPEKGDQKDESTMVFSREELLKMN